MDTLSPVLFAIFYIFSAAIFIFPPNEFVSAGLTIEFIFSKLIGSETEQFIQYHIARAVFTVLVHSCLPLGLVLGLSLLNQKDPLTMAISGDVVWKLFFLISIILPLYVLYNIVLWFYNVPRWQGHPMTKKLALFCTQWTTVASDINVEFRRVDKINLHINSITRVIVTDNWIIKMGPYSLDCAHHSDAALIMVSSDTHHVVPNNPGGAQFINIEVKSTRAGVPPFKIRLNALDFKDLQDKLSRPITILQNVTFHRTLTDRFIDAFREQVVQNPVFNTVQELDTCMGCMQTISNVKLQKLCADMSTGDSACVSCYCRPMWCIDCMAKWYASRQDQSRPETWLESKCTCPVCRSRFCVRDICMVQSET